jgi:hypothetical protein
MTGCHRHGYRHRRRRSTRLRLALMAFVAMPGGAGAQGVQITKLSDIAFGTVADVDQDQTIRQSVCAYSGVLGGRYNVTATGSGAGGAFTLASGAAVLPYEVQWNASGGATSGTRLTANIPLSGQVSTLALPNCTLLSNSGSLIVALRAADLGVATAGSYSGTLTIILAPN